MEKIINLLNDIESKAEKILSHVPENKVELNKQNNNRIKELNTQLKKSTNDKLKSLQSKLEQETEQETLKLTKENKIYLENLEKDYKEHHEQYAQEIFSRMISM